MPLVSLASFSPEDAPPAPAISLDLPHSPPICEEKPKFTDETPAISHSGSASDVTKIANPVSDTEEDTYEYSEESQDTSTDESDEKTGDSDDEFIPSRVETPATEVDTNERVLRKRNTAAISSDSDEEIIRKAKPSAKPAAKRSDNKESALDGMHVDMFRIPEPRNDAEIIVEPSGLGQCK
jgi:hypothetical protein